MLTESGLYEGGHPPHLEHQKSHILGTCSALGKLGQLVTLGGSITQ